MSTCPSCSTSVPPTSTALSSSPLPRCEPEFHQGSIMALKGRPWVPSCSFHRNLRIQNLREVTLLCCPCSWLGCGLVGVSMELDEDPHGSLNHNSLQSKAVVTCGVKGNAVFRFLLWNQSSNHCGSVIYSPVA